MELDVVLSGVQDTLLNSLSFLNVTPVEELLQPVQDYTRGLAETSGLPLDQLQFLFCFGVSYPLAIIFRLIPNSAVFVRNFFSFFFGAIIAIFMVGNGIYHSLFSSAVVYIAMRILPARLGCKFVWVWAFGYMTASHLYRQYVDYMGWTMDFSVIQMVVTLKLCAFATNVLDGTKPDSELSEYQKKMAVKPNEYPSPLEFFGWIYYWCTILAGPFFEFRDYRAFVDGSLFEKTNGKIPSGWWKGVLRVWLRVLLVSVGIVYSFQFAASRLHDAEFIESTSIWYKVFFMYVCCVCTRCKYYMGWSLSEGAVITSGLGFNGYDKDGTAKWDRVQNVDIFGVEFSSNLTEVVNKWNQGTAKWLRYYVYVRLSPRRDPNSKERPAASQSAQLWTFVVSALWHGFYPGYYYFFVLYYLFKVVGHDLGRFFTPMFHHEKSHPVVKNLYLIICVVATQLGLNYLAVSFIILAHSYTLVFWSSFYFAGHFICVAILVASKLGLFRRRGPKKAD